MEKKLSTIFFQAATLLSSKVASTQLSPVRNVVWNSLCRFRKRIEGQDCANISYCSFFRRAACPSETSVPLPLQPVWVRNPFSTLAAHWNHLGSFLKKPMPQLSQSFRVGPGKRHCDASLKHTGPSDFRAHTNAPGVL